MYSRRLEVDPSLWGGRRGGEEEERTRGGDWKRGERRLGEEGRGEEGRRRLRGGGEEKSRG